jgi:hypothetical protein
VICFCTNLFDIRRTGHGWHEGCKEGKRSSRSPASAQRNGSAQQQTEVTMNKKQFRRIPVLLIALFAAAFALMAWTPAPLRMTIHLVESASEVVALALEEPATARTPTMA